MLSEQQTQVKRACDEDRVLLLPPTRDAEAVQRLLADEGIGFFVCDSVGTLCREIANGAGAVVISEEAFTAGSEEYIAAVALQAVWSDLSTILLSRSGSESPRLTSLLSKAGNIAVVERPVRVSTFLSVIRSSLRGRARQYEVREYLKELEKSDEALRKSHDAFFAIVDRAPYGVYMLDAQFRMYSVNAAAQQVFANVRPLIGRDFGEALRVIWPEPVASEAIARFRHTLKTGESHIAPGLTEMRRDVGVTQSFEWEIYRVPLPDGQLGVVCYFYESTKLRRIEAEVRESRRRIEGALLAGEVGTYHWDLRSNRLVGDANFTMIFGVAVDESGAAPLDDFLAVLHHDDVGRVVELIRQTLDDGKVFRAEYRIRCAMGERWVIARGIIVERDDTGAPAVWTGVVVDITERKAAEMQRAELLESERAARAEAERAVRMKDEFLATLSHELRTPLNAILGWTHILNRDKTTPADMTKGLAVIDRNARAQSQIISDLLDMNRIVNGKVRLELQRVNLAAVVQTAADSIAPEAEAKGLRLEVVIDPLAGQVSGDPGRLQQIFWNLLNNAVKFTPKGRGVQVVLRRTGLNAEMCVIDTGDGIDPAFLPHVFDRFRQADGSASRQHGGLGLGLAIVKQLVELHGGTVRADSGGLGLGATFTVTLPIVGAEAQGPDALEEFGHSAAVAAAPHADTYCDISGVKVLVVDDEPDSRELVKRLLENRAAVVTVAASAKEAISALRVSRPDVLISDIGMPGEDGYALMRQVRALDESEGGRILAIALTAYARSEDRITSARAGFQYHLAKPVEPAELIAVVADAMKRSV